MSRCAPFLTVLVAASLSMLAACDASHGAGREQPAVNRRTTDLDTLVTCLTGSFSSAAQAAADPEFFDIRLEMVRIWPERTDGVWLYVEQAAAQTLAQPYRQRVYKLTARDDDRFQSEIFELPGAQPQDVLRWAGAWKQPRPLAELTPEQLVPRPGCTMFIRKVGPGRFVGATEGKGCVSTRSGAAYATSELIELTADGMTTWDRGYDAHDKQVWGAVKAGYQFRRVRR